MCERSKKIEFEDRIQKTDGEDEETVFGLPGAVRSLRIFEEVVVDVVEEFARLGKALKWKIYYFIGFSARASTLGVFFIQTNTLQAWDPPTFPRILRFNFSYETDF